MVQFKRRCLFVENHFTKLTQLKFALCSHRAVRLPLNVIIMLLDADTLSMEVSLGHCYVRSVYSALR